MAAIRRVASSSSRLGFGGEPPGLDPQQAGDRLQVVLDPVVDLSDHRLLALQLALPVPELSDVPHQQQRPALPRAPDHPGRAAPSAVPPTCPSPGRSVPGRPRSGRYRGGGRRFPRRTASPPGRWRRSPAADRPIPRSGWRRGPCPPASSRIIPSPTRGASSGSRASPGNGNIPLPDHSVERAGALEVVLLQLAPPAVFERGPVNGHHRRHLSVYRNRDRLHPDRDAVDDHRLVTAPAAVFVVGAVDHRQLLQPAGPGRRGPGGKESVRCMDASAQGRRSRNPGRGAPREGGRQMKDRRAAARRRAGGESARPRSSVSSAWS